MNKPESNIKVRLKGGGWVPLTKDLLDKTRPSGVDAYGNAIGGQFVEEPPKWEQWSVMYKRNKTVIDKYEADLAEWEKEAKNETKEQKIVDPPGIELTKEDKEALGERIKFGRKSKKG